MTADELKKSLHLQPHPAEGGWFYETYRSPHSTAIYYLLTPDTFSALHRLSFDEVFHFYLGDPVEILQLAPDGTGRIITLGQDLANGQSVQVVVPANTWQGSRLKEGGRWALLGTTVAPSFSPSAYEAGQRGRLEKEYSKFSTQIRTLTPAR